MNRSSIDYLDELTLSNQDAIVFTTDRVSKFSEYVGSVTCNVKNGKKEIAIDYEHAKHSKIPKELFAGIIYLNQNIVQTLGSLVSDFPVNLCTYLGEDMGHNTCQVLIAL